MTPGESIGQAEETKSGPDGTPDKGWHHERPAAAAERRVHKMHYP